MQLQQIKIALAYESSTNPRGKDFAGPAFDDLVASVKEKGVLTPVIARPKPKDGKKFEIVAGNRRFRAAKLAGLAEIPARLEELDDAQAREVQIVENLHREDVHPLDEGNAYRELIEKGKLEIESVAAKVGKGVAYVRQRLHLTNLGKKAADAFRNGKLSAGHAVLIARLEGADQEKALKFTEDPDTDLADLREWIQQLTLRKLSAAPPWKDNTAAVADLAPCEECTKKTGPTLFGEKEAGQCGDPTCFARKLAAHIQIIKADFKKRGEPLTLVAGGWMSSYPKGVLTPSDYRKLDGKDKCPSEHKALVVEGDTDDGLGEILRICTDKNCKVHGSRAGTIHRLTPKEIAARRAAATREANKKKAEARKVELAAKKVKLPLGSKPIAALLEIMIREVRADGVRDLVKAKGWEVLRSKHAGWNGKVVAQVDYELTLRTAAKPMTDEQKLQLVFEGFLMSNWQREKLIKML